MNVKHTLKPIYDANSKVLILGSIPSVKSREIGFYYGHPANRFWKTLSKIYQEEIGSTINDKIIFLNKHHIALFDVLKSCTIEGSNDASIKNPIPNNLNTIIKKTKIKAIFTTGNKAYQLYQKYCYPETHIEAVPLPSTSPANCKKGIDEELIKKYQIIKDITDK